MTLSIYSFGVCNLLAFLVGSFLVWKQARRLGTSEEKIFDTFLFTIFCALIGGRAIYSIIHWQMFSLDPVKILLFTRYPGISLGGALMFGILAAIYGAFANKMAPLLVLDILALAFSCAVVISVLIIFPIYSIVLALATTLLWTFKRTAENNAVLAEKLHKNGFYFLSYLIFFSISLLILSERGRRTEGLIYIFAILFATVFLSIRYKKLFGMAKIVFPANVLTQIRSYLEKKRQDTEKRLGDLKKQDPFTDKANRVLDRASDDDEAQTKAGHERVAALSQQLTVALIQTKKALSKIKIGNYGVCEKCGKMIDTDRLAVMPAATMCLACEKKKEK